MTKAELLVVADTLRCEVEKLRAENAAMRRVLEVHYANVRKVLGIEEAAAAREASKCG